MTITKKTRLLPPPFIGTELRVTVAADQPEFGIYSGTLAPGHEAVTIDWGDGTKDVLDGIRLLYHAYPAPGEYTVRISDDVTSFTIYNVRIPDFRDIYPQYVKELRLSAALIDTLDSCGHYANLERADLAESHVTTLQAGSFAGCTRLAGRIDLPCVTTLKGKDDTQPFHGCNLVSEIHFAATNEAVIRASATFVNDPRLGAENATVYFDL